MFLEEGVEFDLVFPGVLFLTVNDEGRVTKSPVADGFYKPLERLGIDDFDENFLPVPGGEFLDPGRQKKVVFFYVLRVFIEVLVILLVFHLQTQLV